MEKQISRIPEQTAQIKSSKHRQRCSTDKLPVMLLSSALLLYRRPGQAEPQQNNAAQPEPQMVYWVYWPLLNSHDICYMFGLSFICLGSGQLTVLHILYWTQRCVSISGPWPQKSPAPPQEARILLRPLLRRVHHRLGSKALRLDIPRESLMRFVCGGSVQMRIHWGLSCQVGRMSGWGISHYPKQPCRLKINPLPCFSTVNSSMKCSYH